MIPDECIKQLYASGEKLLPEKLKRDDFDKELPTQFFRGTIPDSWNEFSRDCMRHMAVFAQFNAIPKFCFDCYKVSIEPQTVMELFKLMVLFESFKLPKDNQRKCMAECREYVSSGTYKGLIYCSSIEEGENIKKWVSKVIAKEISDKIPITLKRGCSEYDLSYPGFSEVSHVKVPVQYKEEWKEYEEIVDKGYNFKSSPVSNNKPSFDLYDAKVMLAWLKYAATIGDESYLKITSEKIQPWDYVQRPTPFDEK